MPSLGALFAVYSGIPQPADQGQEKQHLEIERGDSDKLNYIHRVREVVPPESTNDSEEKPSEETAEDTDSLENVEFADLLPDDWTKKPPIKMIGYPFDVTFQEEETTSEDLEVVLKKLFEAEGIHAIITSGRREAGAAGKAGDKSHHVTGNAIDIIPQGVVTFEGLKEELLANPTIRNFFAEHNLGLLDETDPKVMAKTGATGQHFHIGPDKVAVKYWNDLLKALNKGDRLQWTVMLKAAYKNALKEKYKDQYNDDKYDRIATFMTCQSALESGWGRHAKGFNYGGHMRNKKVLHYNTLDDFVKAQINTLQKWDFMKADTLEDYINSLYVSKTGKYLYNAHQTASEYYNAVSGTLNSINTFLGTSVKRHGGKFDAIRNLYEKNYR